MTLPNSINNLPVNDQKKKRKGLIITISIISSLFLILALWIIISVVFPAVFYPKSHAGQRQINEMIASAGLKSVMQADYRCTGSLPFVEDYCSSRVEITTDDLGVFETARELTKEFPNVGRVSYIYRGVTFESARDNTVEEMLRFYGFITEYNADNTIVSLDNETKGVYLRIDGQDSFSEVCGLTKSILNAGYSSASVSPSTNTTENPSLWQISGATIDSVDETFDASCSVITAFFESSASKNARVTLQATGTVVNRNKARILIQNINSNLSGYEKETIESWFSGHALPSDVTLSIY